MLTLLAPKTTSQDLESQRQYARTRLPECPCAVVQGMPRRLRFRMTVFALILRLDRTYAGLPLSVQDQAFGDGCQSPTDGSQASAALLGFSQIVSRILRLHHHDLAALLLNLSDIVICQSAVKLDSGRKVAFHKLELLPANSK